jgi:hypothetical protein
MARPLYRHDTAQLFTTPMGRAGRGALCRPVGHPLSVLARIFSYTEVGRRVGPTHRKPILFPLLFSSCRTPNSDHRRRRRRRRWCAPSVRTLLSSHLLYAQLFSWISNPSARIRRFLPHPTLDDLSRARARGPLFSQARRSWGR